MCLQILTSLANCTDLEVTFLNTTVKKVSLYATCSYMLVKLWLCNSLIFYIEGCYLCSSVNPAALRTELPLELLEACPKQAALAYLPSRMASGSHEAATTKLAKYSRKSTCEPAWFGSAKESKVSGRLNRFTIRRVQLPSRFRRSLLACVDADRGEKRPRPSKSICHRLPVGKISF